MRKAESIGALAVNPRLAPVLLVCVGVEALLALPAHAQECGWRVDATPVVTPESPEAVIHIAAWFDRVPGTAELFHRGEFHLRASDPAFLGFQFGFNVLGGSNVPSPMAIEWIRVNQIHWPPNVLGSPANPLLVGEARWRAQEFTPRVVTITAEPTSPAWFSTYVSMSSSAWVPYPGPIQSGMAQIRVTCRADCETTTGLGVLDIFDFLCFQNRYVIRHAYACDCDTGTGSGVCDIFDFLCFQNEFAAGCP